MPRENEDICREKMWELNASGAWPFLFSKVGRYWSGNIEIDIAATDSEGENIILGECKYWSEPVGINVLRDLEEKTKYVDWHRDTRKIWYVLFSASGFMRELEELVTKREDVLLVS